MGGNFPYNRKENETFVLLFLSQLRRQAVSQWLPSSGYELTDAPEISVHHWFHKKVNEAANLARYIELWLPVRKKE